MVTGISFARGVFFSDWRVLACAEVRGGVIHVWAERFTWRTLGKMWVRILFTLPWYYQVLHALLVAYCFLPVQGPVDPWWAAVYAAGFHFVFPRRLKQFHGAEHKVFSHRGDITLEALGEIARASIVNAGCSTNLVTYYFVPFLAALPFLPLTGAIAAGVCGVVGCLLLEKRRRHWLTPFHRLSAFLQVHVTTREPDRLHLETAVRSWRMFRHVQTYGVK